MHGTLAEKNKLESPAGLTWLKNTKPNDAFVDWKTFTSRLGNGVGLLNVKWAIDRIITTKWKVKYVGEGPLKTVLKNRLAQRIQMKKVLESIIVDLGRITRS